MPPAVLSPRTSTLSPGTVRPLTLASCQRAVVMWSSLVLVLVVALGGCASDTARAHSCVQLQPLLGQSEAMWQRDQQIVRIAAELGIDTSTVSAVEDQICAQAIQPGNPDGRDTAVIGQDIRSLEANIEARRTELITLEQRIIQELRKHVREAEAHAFYRENLESFKQLGTIKIQVIPWDNGKARGPMEEIITADNVRLKQEGNDAIISAALELQPGDVTTVFQGEGRYVQITCLEREADTYAAFEDVKQAAAQQLALQKLEEELRSN